jgi:hypothetical protein
VFKAKADPQRELSWAVPISAPDLRPYSNSKPQGEAALRKQIQQMLDGEPRWVETYGNFIRHFMPPPGGTYTGYLDEIRHGVSADTGKLWSFIRLVTVDNLKVDFPAGWPKGLEKRVGKTPREDWIGPKGEFNSGKSPFYYLCQLGLDWDRWTNVELEEAEALFPGHYDSDLKPIEPYFEDVDNWAAELFDACKRHGLKPVQFSTHIHPKHGLSVVKPKGKFFFQLTPIIIEGSQEDRDFQKEKDVFLDRYEKLTQAVLDDYDARFVAGTGKPTKDKGSEIVKGIIVPVVRAYPSLVRKRNDKGDPVASFPVRFEDWRTNGLAVLGFLAERLLQDEDLLEIVDLKDPGKLLAWAKENVTELEDDMTVDEAEDY